MKRTIAALTALLLCLCLLTACGKKQEQAPQPDIQPQTTETKEPETTEPETKEPETKEPDAKEPEKEPETNEPETSEPENNEPETNEPETTEPEPQQPDEPAVFEPAGTYRSAEDKTDRLTVTKLQDGVYEVDLDMKGVPLFGEGRLEDGVLSAELTNWTKNGATIVQITPSSGGFLTVTVELAGGLKSVKNGEKLSYIPGAGVPELDPHADIGFAGVWADDIAHRGVITITHRKGDNYDIMVRWPNGAAQMVMWYMPGHYIDTILTYETGTRLVRTFDVDGSFTDEVTYTDGAGIFRIDDDDMLSWQDMKGDIDEDTLFVRAD